MRIEAVRLAEVGRFRSPVAVEGFSGGLDVLAGPNEAGKSTLFRALRALFEVAHTSRDGKKVGMLRPYDGGAPLVECDFALGERRWRLTKRYLSSPMAELADRDSGRRWRGADAENLLTDMLGGVAGPAPFMPLLWVAQGDAFVVPTPGPDGRRRIERLIEQQIEAASGAGRLAEVAAQVGRELAMHVTPGRGSPRAGSAWLAAIREVEALALEARNAHEAAERSASAREALIAARDDLTRLDDPAAREARALAIEAAQSAIAAAREARQALGAADAARAAASEVEAAARAEHTRLADDIAALAGAGQRIAEAAHAVARHEAETEAVRSARAAAEERRATAVARHAAARAGLRLAVAERRLAAHLSTFADAEAAARRVAEIEAAIAAIGIDERSARALVEARDAVDVNARGIAAEAGTIRIDYEPGREGLVALDGTALAGGLDVALDRPLTLDVAGVGRIEIAPGGGALAERRRRLEQARDQLARGLTDLGIATVEEALAAIERRRSLEVELGDARVGLRSLAPEGLERLVEAGMVLAREREQAVSTAAGVPSHGDLAEYDEALVDELEDEASAAARALNFAVEALAAQQVRLEAAVATLVTERRLHAELAARLPSAELQEASLAAAAARVAETKLAADRAALEARALRERIPYGDAFRAIEAGLVTATTAGRQAEAEIGRLREEIARLEAGLARDDADGVGARAVEVAEQLVAAERRRADFEIEIGALRLLEAEIARAGEGHRKAVVMPVAARLEQLAPHVLEAEARFAIGEAFQLAGITRGAGEEAIDRLSDGTREQIAILTRLAYARLLADAGHPIPLVLDDAMVFADDCRLASLLRALVEASRHHQVVVLTCHELGVAAAARAHGARVLAIDDWPRLAA
ncbi:MAG: AAA family ATPase [Hyphomicrobiaceae bacterium]